MENSVANYYSFAPVYYYQSAKQKYLILLNNIVLENREQFLALKAFSDCLDPLFTGLMEQREKLEVLRKVFKFVFYIFVKLLALERRSNADDLLNLYDLLKINHNRHVKFRKWSVMAICKQTS